MSRLDEIITDCQKTPEIPEPENFNPTYSYTYVGEHYSRDGDASQSSYNKQFTSTEFAVNVTEAISNAHRVGLSNKDIAEVLSKILEEVRTK